MESMTYARPQSIKDAIGLAAQTEASRYLGGGTNLVDLMRERIELPRHLVDVSRLGADIEVTESGGIKIGASVRNSAIAENALVRKRYPVLARAILAGASGQIRNMATTGGNILQRTRCYYFYDDAAACNKRSPGRGCDAIAGFNRIHAILGSSDACVATHPSDMCVALVALDAIVHVQGADGVRAIPLEQFHNLPGEHPEIETVLQPGELVTAVELPPTSAAAKAHYRKGRGRAS